MKTRLKFKKKVDEEIRTSYCPEFSIGVQKERKTYADRFIPLNTRQILMDSMNENLYNSVLKTELFPPNYQENGYTPCKERVLVHERKKQSPITPLPQMIPDEKEKNRVLGSGVRLSPIFDEVPYFSSSLPVLSPSPIKRTKANMMLQPYSRYLLGKPKPEQRDIPMKPYKILDAPDLCDDFYFNVLDWGSKNIIAVALGHCVYLWNATSAQVTKLCELQEMVTSLSWHSDGESLGVGTISGSLIIYDIESLSPLSHISAHSGRIGCLSWWRNVLTSGSQDKLIKHWDKRSNLKVLEQSGHDQEICGLKWDILENRLASGGNDNLCLVWDRMSSSPVCTYSHLGAVKALSWSPHTSGLLASGGGTADRHISFWNTKSSESIRIKSVPTDSQVCNLAWSSSRCELVSTHGFSDNNIILWSYPNLEKIATIDAHKNRVLYLACSPDGCNICTGAGDETLRFWSLFPKKSYDLLPCRTPLLR